MNTNISAKVSAFFAPAAVFLKASIPAYALKITADAKASDFDDYSLSEMQGVMLGTVFWILRLLGVLALIWGLYGFIIGRRNGDPRQYSGAWAKIALAFCLIMLPVILKAVDIISF